MFQKYRLDKACYQDSTAIWELLQEAILKRKEEGSDQWQNGYPNPEIINRDIENGYGYKVTDPQNDIVGYLAVIFDKEPAYEVPEANWLTYGPYVVIHRLAVSQTKHVKGLASWIMQEAEKIAIKGGRYSIKVDTNHDNQGMLRIFEKLQYTQCGRVYLSGGERIAFEKKLA